MKFKVGDKVKVIEFERLEKKFSRIRTFSNGRRFTKDMQKLCGKVVTIEKVCSSYYTIHEDGWCWDDNMLEPVNEKKIVITSDGTETLARLYEGKKVVLTATGKCSPDDTFDFKMGAEIAFNRLMGVNTVKEEKLKYYNGKVVCVGKNLYDPYTVGKVYEFKDGRVADDRGEMFPIAQEPIKTLEEWNDDPIKRVKFIPFVE